jgi:ribosomal protein S18 acetylase RimI-like enzyme
MTAELEVRQLEPAEIGAAGELLTRAFWDSPLVRVLAPDPGRRTEICRWFFEAHARYGLLHGDAWTAADQDGALLGAGLWWAPEHVEPDDERSSQSGLADGPLVVGPAGWARLQELSSAFASLHRRVVPEPHWYLTVLGVDPDCQGRGIGGAILQPVLDYLDEERLPAFLETGLERNLAFYRRHGFEVGAEASLPSVGMTVWAMRRDPR